MGFFIAVICGFFNGALFGGVFVKDAFSEVVLISLFAWLASTLNLDIIS